MVKTTSQFFVVWNLHWLTQPRTETYMKQPLLVLMFALLIAVPNLGSAVPQVPAGHPGTTNTPPGHPNIPSTPPGHPETNPMGPELAPAGDPADYPEYVKSIESIVNAAFEAISGPRGQERDWEKYRQLFFKDARLYSVRVVHTTSIVGGLTVEEFIKAESNYLKGSGYFEKPLNMKIEQFSNIASVRSVYEVRHRAEEEMPYLRGIYNIQLVNAGGRWWILNMLWQTEDPRNPIPEEYLK